MKNGNGKRKEHVRIIDIKKIATPSCEMCSQMADWVLLTSSEEVIVVCDFHKIQIAGHSV